MAERSALRFVKYHGLGNDFLVVDAASEELDPKVVRWLCSRRLGVGADGVLLVLAPRVAEAAARMVIINADGSHAEMCGNGLRCFVRHLAETGQISGEVDAGALIETDAGPLWAWVRARGEEPWQVEVEVGAVSTSRSSLPMLGEGPARARLKLEDGREVLIEGASLGNPHGVILMDDPASMAWASRYGAELSNHRIFPQRANIGFAYIAAKGRIDLTVYERGCGITQACGTGAAAAAFVAARSRGWGVLPVEVRLPGGSLEVRFSQDGGALRLMGPAARVFSGESSLPAL